MRGLGGLVLVLAVILTSGPAHSHYGIDFDARKDIRRAGASTFVPVNADVFRLRQPDGVERLFIRDADDEHVLNGQEPWVAERDGRRSLVMTDPEFTGGQTGFMFVDGMLRNLLLDGKEYKIPPLPPGVDGQGMAALWPEKGQRLCADEAPDVWKDSPRWRLWFDNPNKAGLLFAEIAIAAFAFILARSLWMRILGAVFALAAFGGLAATSSRGALLALLCGLAAMALTRARRFFDWRFVAIAATVLALAVGALYGLGQGERMVKNLFREGQQETSRLRIWKEVPRMVADAPGGWGFGQSARAYVDWYQEKNDCLLKNMISGHLTFLVEAGWALAFAYAFAWFFLFGLTFRQALKGGSPVPLGILAALFVAACFNPVLSVPELGVIPAAAAGFAMLQAWRRREETTRAVPVAAVCASVCLMGGLVGTGTVLSKGQSLRVNRSGGAVCLNGNRPEVWVADDDYCLHGGYWWKSGQEIRNVFRRDSGHAAVGYVRDVADLPDGVERIVLVGEQGLSFLRMERRPKAKTVVFLAPPFGWKAVPENLRQECKVELVVGGVAARHSPDYAEKQDWVRVVPGAELYIPGWVSYLTDRM